MVFHAVFNFSIPNVSETFTCLKNIILKVIINQEQELFLMNLFVVFKVYNDADILEKIMKDRRKDLGPATDDDDMMSPKLKIST